MPPTTLKLPPELKQRIRAVADAAGTSAHAFMLAALERETELAEKRQDFVASALQARAELARTGKAYDAREVHAYVRDRAAGRRTARPKARKWPR